MFNVPLLQQELDLAGIPNHGVDSAGSIAFKDEATQPLRDQAAAIVAAHNPAAMTVKQSSREELRAFLDNRADDLKYADYFFSRSIALSAQWMPPRDTNLTTLTTATVTIMQGNRATDVNHNAMWRIFLWKLRMKYNIFNTEDELPNPLTGTQARQLLIEADSFIKWGVDASHILLLRDLV